MSKFALLLALIWAMAGLSACGPGAGTYCQSGPKYGTQCYSQMDLQPPGSPPTPADGQPRR
jgi:hypothetical protein